MIIASKVALAKVFRGRRTSLRTYINRSQLLVREVKVTVHGECLHRRVA